MNPFSFRQLQKSMMRSARVLFTAFMAASLLLGLIPPPLIEGVTTHTADLTGFENLSGLADVLPEPTTAKAAPAGSSAYASSAAPLADLSLSTSHMPLLQGGTITGQIFVDFDRDGNYQNTAGGTDSGEVTPPFPPSIVGAATDVTYANFVITATDAQGNVATGTIGVDGTYSIDASTLSGDDFRIELSVPGDYRGTLLGSDTATAQPLISFIQGTTANVPNWDIGVLPPSQCAVSGTGADGNANVAAGKLWTTCMVNGDKDDTDGPQDVWVGLNYDNSGTVEHLYDKAALGSIWGVAYDEWDSVLFTSAMLKRHSELGPRGVDGLYWMVYPDETTLYEADLGSVTGVPPGLAFIDAADVTALETNRDFSGIAFSDPSTDPDAFTQVAKVGIGDIDATPSGQQLLVVNLHAKALMSYDISNADNGNIGYHGALQFTDAQVNCPNVSGSANASDWRPWALHILDSNTALVGFTCTAETSRDGRDLAVTMHRVTLGANAVPASSVEVWRLDDLVYDKGCAFLLPNCFDATSASYDPTATHFQPWLRNFNDLVYTETQPGNIIRAHGATPLFAGIAIDSAGNAMVSIMDRTGDQLAADSYDLDGPGVGDSTWQYASGGELLYLCNTGTLTAPVYVTEGDTGCPVTNFPDASVPAGWVAHNDFHSGPYDSDNEWFGDERQDRGTGVNNHGETTLGGLFIRRGSDEVVSSQMDPDNITNAGGLEWFDIATGTENDAIVLYGGQTAQGLLGKANGIGDLDGCFLENEIGNRVWLDSDGDGIQDPDEEPIEGVDVVLTFPITANLALLGTATASNEGFFGSVAADATDGNTDGIFNNGSVWSADGTTPQPWWQVDLGSSRTIDSIDVWNRTDCCSDRLSNAWVFADDQDFTAGNNLGTLADAITNADFSFQLGDMNGDVLESLNVNTNGRYVRIWSDGTAPNASFMQIAEVNIWGEVTSTFTTTTDANGEYYFNDANVTGGLLPNRAYTLTVDTTQAAVAAYELTTANVDSGTTLPDGLDSDGVLSGTSAVINLTTGDAGYTEHTFDFGFKVPSVRIGNRVWYDTNDNGLIDGFESAYGIDGVTVELLDSTGTITATTTTANGGYYLFTTNLNNELLQDGDYQVRIPATNNMGAAGSALPLDDWRSSTDTGNAADPNTDVDSDDNGSGTTDGVNITSGTVSLAAGTEPTQTVDTDDADGNLTVDFGFYDMCSTANGDLGGNIFRDFNSDGLQDIGEPGWIDGITVTAYDNDGNAVTTTINPDGSYDFDAIFPNPVTDADHIRLEFSGLPDWAQSGVSGTNSGTTVQHHKAASCDADLAVQNPADYCESNPSLVTGCYLFGDPSSTFSDDGGTAAIENASILRFQRNDAPGDGQNEYLATVAQTGAVGGIAVQDGSQTMFAGSIAVRGTDYGPGADGTLGTADDAGAIYIVDLATPDTTNTLTVINIPNANRNGSSTDVTPRGVNGIGFTSTDGAPVCPTAGGTATRGPDFWYDSCFFDEPGKQGLGDLEINDDEDTLYVVNVGERSLYVVDVTNASTPGTPQKVGDLIGSSWPTCTGGEWRPWALAWNDGELYVGGVCSGETSGDFNDLSAHVFRVTDLSIGQTNVAAIEVLAHTDMAYDKDYHTFDISPGGFEEYRAWIDEWDEAEQCQSNAFGACRRPSWPQPMLTDIEFDDDGAMILGIRDRFMDQISFEGLRPGTDSAGNRSVGPNESAMFNPASAGDLIRACKVGTDSWTWETGAAGACPAPPNEPETNTATLGQLSSVPEYYWGDRHLGDGTQPRHAETAQGHIALVHGTGEVASIDMDPVIPSSAGVSFYNNTTGGVNGGDNGGYQIFEYDNRVTPNAVKGNGLGDLEYVCALAPLEIGNYVWLDEDGDGIQDPCEDPIPGVTVTLYDITGTLVAQTTTDANGEYYFRDSSVVTQTWLVGTSLLPNTQYEIRIDTTQAAVSDHSLTTANANSGTTLPDAVDSDGVESGSNAVISLTTGDAGQNDHTFDFGFVPIASLALEKTLVSPANGIAMVGDTMTFQLQISNTGSVTVTELNLVDRYDPAILQYVTASITPDSQSAGSITWASVDGDGNSLDANLPLAPGVSFIVTVDMEVIAPTRE